MCLSPPPFYLLLKEVEGHKGRPEWREEGRLDGRRERRVLEGEDKAGERDGVRV